MFSKIYIMLIMTFLILGCGNSDDKKNSDSSDRNSPLNEEVDQVEELQKKFEKFNK